MKSVCITERAYAKLNLSLRVVDKLPNKFHSIQSHVTFLPELFDTLHIKKSTKNIVKLRAAPIDSIPKIFQTNKG